MFSSSPIKVPNVKLTTNIIAPWETTLFSLILRACSHAPIIPKNITEIAAAFIIASCIFFDILCPISIPTKPPASTPNALIRVPNPIKLSSFLSFIINIKSYFPKTNYILLWQLMFYLLYKTSLIFYTL